MSPASGRSLGAAPELASDPAPPAAPAVDPPVELIRPGAAGAPPPARRHPAAVARGVGRRAAVAAGRRRGRAAHRAGLRPALARAGRAAVDRRGDLPPGIASHPLGVSLPGPFAPGRLTAAVLRAAALVDHAVRDDRAAAAHALSVGLRDPRRTRRRSGRSRGPSVPVASCLAAAMLSPCCPVHRRVRRRGPDVRAGCCWSHCWPPGRSCAPTSSATAAGHLGGFGVALALRCSTATTGGCSTARPP